ncbi:MAG: hypothetical protein QNJ72_14210 [Pleurocapsa sp. MO_226.B13]|nr:hypothetical protein [Pleurocapsa sp. MO_226.B13]
MKNWYLTREAGNLQHRGLPIPEGKKIMLTEEQAKLHNKAGEKVVLTDAPKEAKEVGVLAEFQEWTKAKPENKKADGRSTPTLAETSPTKAKK